jgi:hypothetical protein
MKKFFYFVGIFVSAALLIAAVMGVLFFLLIWLPAKEDYMKEADIECPEGGNSYLCVIRGYLHPKEPESI